VNKYYRIVAWLIVLVMGVVLVACGATEAPAPTEAPAATEAAQEATEAPAPTETPEPEEAEPVILRVGILADVDCWNPYACASVWFQGHILLEGFTDHGPASTGCEAIPRLADSWEVSEDGRTWTIKLHEGITFSDGSPADAQAIVDFITWQWNSPEMQVWFAELVAMESIEARDGGTSCRPITGQGYRTKRSTWLSTTRP
jgi:ABC-type transport system substrate-binding protein